MLITIRRETTKPTCAGTMAIDGQPFGFTLPGISNRVIFGSLGSFLG